jgi:hypothetical protein
LLKLAENVQNGKTGITLFSMNMNRDTALNDFQDFFNGACFLFFKFDQISWRPSLEPSLRSVEMFWLTLMVPEI